MTGLAASPDPRKLTQGVAYGEQREALDDFDEITRANAAARDKAAANAAARGKAAVIAKAADRSLVASLALQARDNGKVTLKEDVPENARTLALAARVARRGGAERIATLARRRGRVTARVEGALEIGAQVGEVLDADREAAPGGCGEELRARVGCAEAAAVVQCRADGVTERNAVKGSPG